MNSQVKGLRIILDNILVINLFIVIAGSILFISGIIFSLNGNQFLYNMFQKLWFPLFLPTISIFFTAVVSDALLKLIIKEKS